MHVATMRMSCPWKGSVCFQNGSGIVKAHVPSITGVLLMGIFLTNNGSDMFKNSEVVFLA